MKNKNRILLTPWNQQLFFGLWENDRPSELAFFDLEDQPKQGDRKSVVRERVFRAV